MHRLEPTHVARVNGVQPSPPVIASRLSNDGLSSDGDAIPFAEINGRLERLEASLTIVAERLTALLEIPQGATDRKEWFTTAAFALAVGKAPFTVREWARHGRIKCQRANSGRGPYSEYRIHVSELERYRRYGLLPLRGAVARRQRL